MNNYKIKVNNEAESKESQELFFELGYKWCGYGATYVSICGFKFITAYSDEMRLAMGWGEDAGKELTTPQLRDMVVLHRNDVKDANYKLFISPSQGYLSFYKASDDVFYAYAEKSKCWDKSRSVDIKNKDLEPIQSSKEDDQRLISGADALRALADGKEVQCTITGKNEWTKDIYSIQPYYFVGGGVGQFQFRIKPRTVKIELEIPAPFEPKEGDMYWHISPEYMSGYANSMYNDGNVDTWQQFGAWRTKEEIKQVVAALRGGIKA